MYTHFVLIDLDFKLPNPPKIRWLCKHAARTITASRTSAFRKPASVCVHQKICTPFPSLPLDSISVPQHTPHWYNVPSGYQIALNIILTIAHRRFLTFYSVASTSVMVKFTLQWIRPINRQQIHHLQIRLWNASCSSLRFTVFQVIYIMVSLPSPSGVHIFLMNRLLVYLHKFLSFTSH